MSRDGMWEFVLWRPLVDSGWYRPGGAWLRCILCRILCMYFWVRTMRDDKRREFHALRRKKWWTRHMCLKFSVCFGRMWRRRGLSLCVVAAAAAAAHQHRTARHHNEILFFLNFSLKRSPLTVAPIVRQYVHVPGKARRRQSHKDWLANLHVQVAKYPRGAGEELHIRTRVSGNLLCDFHVVDSPLPSYFLSLDWLIASPRVASRGSFFWSSDMSLSLVCVSINRLEPS